MMFDHYLITRFNLRKADWSTSKNNVPVLTREWHINRFELFETYCFPSVQKQTNQNFKWLVFFDRTTPQDFKARIKELRESYVNFIPFYIDGMDSFLPAIQKELAKSTSDYVISSRLDNDDCLAIHFIDEVQKRFIPKNAHALDFVDGYTLQTGNSYKLGKKRHYYNPFISYIELNKDPKSVWYRDHGAWKKERELERITNCRIWMSIIHTENKVNEFTGYGKVSQKVLDNFGMDEQQKNHIKSHLVPQQRWRWRSLNNKRSTYFKCYYKDFKRAIRLGFK